MIVLDASVLIAHLDEDDALHARAEAALDEAADEPFGCSTVTLAEVLVGSARAGRLDAARTAIDELGVAEIPLGDGAPERLARLRADTGLKLPDCCVLLAQDASAGSILSFDDRLDATARRLARGGAREA